MGAVALGIMAMPMSGSLPVGDEWLARHSKSAASERGPHGHSPDFGPHLVSGDVRNLAYWITASRDHLGGQYVVVDKKSATVHVFDSASRLLASSPVLLGSAKGDDSAPGIGSRPISEVRPEERTTPSGRFIAERGRNLSGEDVIWVDYDNAVSMHRVRTTNPVERRLERLATASIDDNRISYGCINVPISFYETYLRPIFAFQRAVVYVLPEIKDMEQVFSAYGFALPNHLATNR